MFTRNLESVSPWTDRNMFDNIIGGLYREMSRGVDVSFIATMRALLARRLPENEQFSTSLISLPNNADVIECPVQFIEHAVQVSDSARIDDICNTIIVMQYKYDAVDDAIAKLIASLDKTFLNAHPEWTTVQKTDSFLNQYCAIRVLINKKNNSALLVTGALTMPTWHLIQSAIPTYVPELFKEIPLDQKEKAMLKALTSRSSASYIRAMAELEEYYDIRAKKIRSIVGGFEKRVREQQVQSINSEIERIGVEMTRLMERYKEFCERRDAANIRRNGMLYVIDHTGDNNELVDFFSANKSLDVVDVSGSTITFIVRTCLDNFDADAYEVYSENERFLGETAVSSGVFESAENRKLFMDALFLENKFKIKLCAVYHLDIRGTLDTSSNYHYPANCSDYLPNYHLQRHECLGDYKRVVCGYLERGDTIGAINACIASAKSININESGPTFNPFMREVFTTNARCIQMPDGTSVTPTEAFRTLKGE